MTVWGKNQDVPEKQDKYNIVVLEIDCDKKLADNPKLPRNSYLVTYMTDGGQVTAKLFDANKYIDASNKGATKKKK